MEGGYMTEYTQGRIEGANAVEQFGLTQAEAMVDYLMALDNNGIYALAFSKSVSDARIDSLS